MKHLFLTALLALTSTPPRGEDGGDAAKHAQNLQSLLTKHNGDAMALVGTLLAENATYRETNRTLRDDAEKAKVPEGAVVLSKADAERWTAYQALGKPDEVKTKLGERDGFEQEATGLKREKHLSAIEKVSGVKASVLMRVAPDGTTYEVGKGKDAEGKDIDVVRVKDKDGKDVGEMREWIDKTPELADFKAALIPAAETEQRTSPIFVPPLGGAGQGGAGRTPEQVRTDKLSSGDYSI